MRLPARPDWLRVFSLYAPQLRSAPSAWEQRRWQEALRRRTALLQQDAEMQPLEIQGGSSNSLSTFWVDLEMCMHRRLKHRSVTSSSCWSGRRRRRRYQICKTLDEVAGRSPGAGRRSISPAGGSSTIVVKLGMSGLRTKQGNMMAGG